MQTIFTTSPAEAAKFIKRGGTVAFPTETVYGLGADIFDEIAVAKIFEAKNRPADNPLIAHIADLRQIMELSDCVNRNAQKFIDAFFPGPLTIVCQKRTGFHASRPQGLTPSVFECRASSLPISSSPRVKHPSPRHPPIYREAPAQRRGRRSPKIWTDGSTAFCNLMRPKSALSQPSSIAHPRRQWFCGAVPSR